mmetsp:Transcript_60321/g.127736  ORF Transcript_60321/g.127736 Transcript_60321/m.127736 type:complete len:387 (+) Transcript_60321:1316-2476(+)
MLGDRAEERGEFVLVGGDLSVAGLERDAHLEALMLNFLHALQHWLRFVNGGHVVIAELLTTGRQATHDRAASHLQVRALVELVPRNEEELLLQTDVDDHRLDADAESAEEADARFREGLHGALQRGLLVEGFAFEGDEASREVDAVTTQEHGALRINGEVPASTVGDPKTTVRVRGTVGLTSQQVLALQVPHRFALLVELPHGQLHLSHLAVAVGGGQWLEPMAKHRGATIGAPIQDSLCHLVSLGRILDPASTGQVLRGQSIPPQVGGRHSSFEEVLAIAQQECLLAGSPHELCGAGTGSSSWRSLAGALAAALEAASAAVSARTTAIGRASELGLSGLPSINNCPSETCGREAASQDHASCVHRSHRSQTSIPKLRMQVQGCVC